MSTIYNALLHCANAAIKTVTAFPGSPTKTRRFLEGNARAVKALADFRPAAENYWFHCSSLGEYAIARPLMEELKHRRPDCRIALTFFSPTGVEAVSGRRNIAADFVGFLPSDTPGHARLLLDRLRPAAALFMVSEYWPNYLLELHRRHIPTYLVSTIFSHKAPHFGKITGEVFRRSLRAYTRIFTLNRRSVENLAELGFTRATVCGDPLVDNAVKVAATPWHNEAMAAFCAKGRTLIAGSLSDSNDLELIAAEVNAHPERRYMLVPHEVDESHLGRLEDALGVPSRRLSRYEKDMPENVLIVDHVGSLAYLYRLGFAAYIGGGFTSQLHSVLEAVVYGLPISFGPRTERKVVPAALVTLGTATITRTPGEFRAWTDAMFAASDSELAALRERNLEFCRRQTGATDTIITEILTQNSAS